jgi:hypothetical protein
METGPRLRIGTRRLARFASAIRAALSIFVRELRSRVDCAAVKYK